MSILVNRLITAASDADPAVAPHSDLRSDQRSDETKSPAGYCTSEQMDLWRQVFAEADHRALRLAAQKNFSREGSRKCA
jgi:hypothetical protein